MKRTSRIRAAFAPLAVAVALAMVAPALALPIPALPSTPPAVNVGVPFNPIATVYAEDFEFSDGGYTTGGTPTWQHGSAVSPPTPVAGQGPGMWGTNLAGDYESGACGYVDSATIDLSGYVGAPSTGVSAARLAFRHWMHFEQRYDGGAVFASTDGANWQRITPTDGYTHTMLTSARACLGLELTDTAWSTPSAAPADDAWRLAEFDITPFLGSVVQFRWMMASDASVVKRGWYLDDVVVQVGAGASATMPLPQLANEAGVPFAPAATLYADDFEGSDGGWTVDGTMAWEWGAPTAPPVSATGSLNMWGTRLNSDYQPNECSALTSPVISLPGADTSAAVQAAQLSFKLWRFLENGYDAAHLEASTDGGATWARLTPADGYDRTLTSSYAAGTRACLGITTSDRVWSGPSSAPKEDEFMDVTVDVTHLMGNDVMFRFVMGSDGDTERRGAYVDDVIVQVGAGAVVSIGEFDGGASLPNPLWSVEGTNPSWEYGFPTAGPVSLTPVWATNLAGQYNPSECSAIVSRPIDTATIPGLGRLELAFQHFFDTYSSLDGGVIQVSDDGGASWNVVTPVGGYGGSLGTNARNCIYGGATPSPGWYGAVATDWTNVIASLSSYQGDTIQIRFIFGTSASGQDIGWHLRNVALSRGAGSVPLTMAGMDVDALLSKADGELRAALESGVVEDLRVIVTGKSHEGVADLGFATREEYVAWFDQKGGPLVDELTTIARKSGGQTLNAWTMLPGMAATLDLPALVTIAQMDDVESIALDKDDAVKLVEPIPDETVDASNTQGRQQLQAEDIWALGYKGAGITVTVIDTGIWPGHEAFKYADGSTRILRFANCVDGTCDDTAPAIDDHGHGTHVAGTAVGSSLYNDATYGYFQETGVAPEATLTVGKFLSGSGSGSFAGAIDTLNWAFTVAQADLTSNSWGASGCSSSAHGVMQAVRTMTDAGMLNVFAAGNSGSGSSTIGSPGCSESALTVGAIDVNKNIASFSSRGPCTDTEIGGTSRICPDVVAKGVAVRSAIPRSGAAQADPSGYKTWQGTSMATPHIAGAVILAEQMKRALSGSGWDTAARAEEQVFKLTAMDLGAAGEDNTFGWGLPQLLNVYALLDATDEARLVAAFGVSNPVVRQGDSTLLSFSVRNLGGAMVAGDFLATLEDPEGAMTTIKSSSVNLGLLDGEQTSLTFSVGNSVLPGTYTFRGSFAYTWTNSTSGEVVTGVIERVGTFDVKRVFVAVDMAGLDAQTHPGDLQVVTYTATNTGNEDAQNVVIEFTVPDKYVFVPSGLDGANGNSRYANPAPDRVVEDKNFGRVTLIFEVGSLAQGDSFSFTTQMLPTLPGTYRFLSVARFEDGGGNGFSQGALATQVVGLPA